MSGNVSVHQLRVGVPVVFVWFTGLLFPHLPGEGCQILSELLSSSSSASSSASSSNLSSTMSASTSTSTSGLPTLRQALRQLPSSVRTAGPQPGTFPAQCALLDLNLGQCAPLDLNLGPSQLSAHRWTSTWDLPSSVRTAGPQPGTFRAQCAPLDLNLGPSQLSAHRWTSTARQNARRYARQNVRQNARRYAR